MVELKQVEDLSGNINNRTEAMEKGFSIKRIT